MKRQNYLLRIHAMEKQTAGMFGWICIFLLGWDVMDIKK